MPDHSGPGAVQNDLIAAQARYHHDIYHSLWDWSSASRAIEEAGLRDLDQLGHFGAPGCDLIVDAVARHDPSHPLRLAELGSGLGGALHYLVRRLADRGITVALAVGLDAVVDHCRLMGRIGEDSSGTRFAAVCTSVDAPGLRPGSFDVVFATGSASHFARMGATLAAAARLLCPGGLLTFTEEVSLTGPTGPPSAEFRALHPPSVFFTATRDERRAQLEAAGLTGIAVHDIAEWAAATLRRRMLAIRLHQQNLASVYGTAEAKRILDTITVAREEVMHGRLGPAHVIAHRPPGPAGGA